MLKRGTGTSGPSRRFGRRTTFLSLLLVAVAAPAGLVFAGEQPRPYVVIFDEFAVSRTVVDQARTPLLAPSGIQARPDVKVRREVDGNRVRRQVSEIQARFRMRATNVYDSSLGGFSADLTPAQVRALERNPAVASVMPDEQISVDDGTAGLAGSGIRTTSRPQVRIPAGIRRVGASQSNLSRVDGRDSRVNADVAIIDTGVERNHPDLNVVGGYNCTGRNRNKWDDDDGHGTHVAGIVGALDNRVGVVGVAPGARLWSVKVLDRNGRGMLSWMVCGVNWVTAQRERGNPQRPLIEVANMSISLGIPGGSRECDRQSRDWLHLAICRSVERGTVYVTAAGNESHNARHNRPAAYDEVITVSAMADYDGRGGGRGSRADSCPYWTPERDDSFTTFSNFGPDVDLIAPGRCILSTFFHRRYAWMSGTSMASPHVAGAAAVYRAAYPRANPRQVRQALLAVGTRDWRTQSDPDNSPERAVWIGSFRHMPDFNVSGRQSMSNLVTDGARSSRRLTVNVSISRIGGFEDEVTLGLVDPPRGFRAAAVSTARDDAALTVYVARNVVPGRYTLTVRGTAYDLDHTTTVTVNVGRGAMAQSSAATFSLAAAGY